MEKVTKPDGKWSHFYRNFLIKSYKFSKMPFKINKGHLKLGELSDRTEVLSHKKNSKRFEFGFI